MKADKQRRVTIPGLYLRKSEIRNLEKVQISRGSQYGKFYLTSEQENDAITWKTIGYLEQGNKLRLPKEMYSEKSNYSFGIDKGGLYLLKSA